MIGKFCARLSGLPEPRVSSVSRTWPRTRWLLRIALLLCLPGVADAATNALEAVSFSSLPGDRVQVTLKLSSPAPKPLSFTIDNPARIALDLPDTRNELASKTQNIGIGAARSISAAEANGRTRVVLNLVQLVPYETRTEGNNVYVTLGGSPASATATSAQTVAESSSPPSSTSPTGTSSGNEISNLDFRRGEQGEARITVTLPSAAVPVDMHQEGDQIVVDFLNTNLPERLQRRLDVTDFATPVRSIDTFRKGDGVRMVITPVGEYDHLAYQSNNIYTVEVKPVTKEKKEEEKKEKFGYTGERLSLNFQNIEVRAVLQLIADFTGLNLVTSDTVQGNLTLRLKNVPWDQALDIILKTKGLGMRRSGNVILVAPSEEIAAREKLELEAQKQLEELAPLRSEFVQINYAKASDIASLVKAKENSLLSPRGSVTIDERTNTLLVQDTADKLAEIRRLVATLDIPVRQVLIESRVVIANDDFNRELGVRFGATVVKDGGDIVTTGSTAGTTNLIGQPFDPVNVGTTTQRLNVNLPVLSPAGQIAFALLGSDYLVDLELSALQAEGRGEVISSPRVITANQKQALIEQGVEIPYQEASSSGATSVSFKKAVLSLKVTPQITPDDRVIMDLSITKDSVGEVFDKVPAINTREVATQVLVDNGETVVLGGIYEQTRSKQVNMVPFLGSLPGVGFLFRDTLNVNDKAELLIFVTPKIIKESLTLK